MRDALGRSLSWLWVLLLVSGCAPVAVEETPTSAVASRLQERLDALVAENPEVPAAALSVRSPSRGLEWSGAAGAADPASGKPMTPEHPVRLASNTKTFIAASVLRLWEDNRLGLDDPIAEHLPGRFVTVLRTDGYRPEAITIRHLLTHTAGLYDYADRVIYTQRILDEPRHRWTREEQLEAAVAWGDPLGQPGEIYSYSDTGYILLGSVIEQVTAMSMPAAVRTLLDYRSHGLRSTWFDTLEPRPAGVPDLAHQFTGDVDAADIDASADLYGGGGITATVVDLGRFTDALFSGSLYRNADTLATMLTTVDNARLPEGGEVSRLPAGAYRMGVWVADAGGLEAYWHTGFWGTAAVHVPALELTVAAAVTQNREREALVALVNDAVSDVRMLMPPHEAAERTPTDRGPRPCSGVAGASFRRHSPRRVVLPE